MKNKLVLPNYENSIMNITATILKHYGLETSKKTLPVLEQELSKGYKNVILFLVDALGSEIIKKHPITAKYLKDNQIDTLTTVFPSTTVAATISAVTGKAPVNNGWIGWLQYVKEEDSNVIFFRNTDFYTHKTFDYDVANKYCPIERVYETISENNPNIKSIEVFPEFRTPEHKRFKDLCNTIIKECKNEDSHYIYAYWDKVDTYLHETGTTSKKVDDHLLEVSNGLKYLSESLGEDSLIIVTADHGQIDIEEIPLWDYSKIIDTFEHNPSIESRATAFFIKEGKHEVFEEEFKKNFSESFILYKSKDFLKTHILGYGEEHYKVKEFLGDYFAIGISNKSFKLSNSKHSFKAQHAGITADEMLIPLIFLSQKK